MCAACPRANSAQPIVLSHAAVIATRPSLTEIRRPAASVRGAARGAVPLLQWRHRRPLCLQHASRRRCLCDHVIGAQARRATSDGSPGKKIAGVRDWGAVGRWIHLISEGLMLLGGRAVEGRISFVFSESGHLPIRPADLSLHIASPPHTLHPHEPQSNHGSAGMRASRSSTSLRQRAAV